jgi:Saxitoxin biosynthesis operon protein SxtJ
MEEGVPAGLSRSEARRFGLTIGAAFLALAGVLWWRGRVLPAEIAGSLGVVLVLTGLIFPGSLPPVHRVWMAGALAISKVTTPIVLAVLYFGVLTPIGLMRRLFGGSPIDAKRGPGSLWVERVPQGRAPADMEHQF